MGRVEDSYDLTNRTEDNFYLGIGRRAPLQVIPKKDPFVREAYIDYIARHKREREQQEDDKRLDSDWDWLMRVPLSPDEQVLLSSLNRYKPADVRADHQQEVADEVKEELVPEIQLDDLLDESSRVNEKEKQKVAPHPRDDSLSLKFSPSKAPTITNDSFGLSGMLSQISRVSQGESVSIGIEECLQLLRTPQRVSPTEIIPEQASCAQICKEALVQP